MIRATILTVLLVVICAAQLSGLHPALRPRPILQDRTYRRCSTRVCTRKLKISLVPE